MLSYSDLKPKTFITLDGEPYEVLSSHVFRKQQRKPVNQTKLRGLKTGKVIPKTFHTNDSVEEADIETRPLVFLYAAPGKGGRGGEAVFHEAGDPKARFSAGEEVVGDTRLFLKAKSEVAGLFFGGELIGVRVPIKLHLKVAETSPNVKGNTAQGGTKPATLETGATVTVPMFVAEGDIVEVNTDKGEYVRRIEQA